MLASQQPEASVGNAAIRFREEHDLHLLLVMMGKADAFSRDAGKDWEDTAECMRKAFPEMKGLTARTCKERCLREIKAFVVSVT